MSTIELVAPRICWIPESSDESLGARAVEWAREHKMRLDVEQEFMLSSSLGVDADGRWQAFEVGMNAPRQNGKGEVLMARELFGLYELGERLIVHSAHEFKTAARHFARLEAAIRRCDDLFYRMRRSDRGNHELIGFRYSHGDEAIELEDGAKIEFRTRTKSGMKGFDDVAVLMLDEAQVLSEWAHGAMVPTLRASTAERGPQLWYAGNAPDQERDEHAIVWTRVRERGLEGGDEGLVYHEYSLDFESPDEIPDEVLEDPEMWARVNWAMAHGRVRESHMAKELKSLGRRQFCVELLGVGDYPDTELGGNSEIDMDVWAELEEPGSELNDPVTFSIEVSPARRSTITTAGLNSDGYKHVEMVNSRAGTGWVAERVGELWQRHHVVEVACDGFGPANTIANQIEDLTGIEVRRLKTGEYADACGLFANEVAEREVRHLGQEELTTSLRGARTRPLVDRWAWSRSKSKTDPGPLIGASIALWSAVDNNIGMSSSVGIF